MTHQTPISTSWNGGEVSPLMIARVDTAIYAIAAEKMENFAPAIEGPAQKCPGFRRIRAADASAAWMERFVFNDTQAYALELGEKKIRFYTNGGRIEDDPDTPYEVAVPYAAADWPYVSMQQSYDRLYMALTGTAPAALSRTDATTFGYATLSLTNGPFKDGNTDTASKVTIAGVLTEGGTVTITSMEDIFVAPVNGSGGHVGGLFQVEALDFSDVAAWEVGISDVVAGTTTCRSDGKVYVAASSGRTGTAQPIHEEGTEWDGSGWGTDINEQGPYGVQWTYVHDRFGIIRITAVADARHATGEVVRRIPDSLKTVASWRWAHGAFSDAEGWPNLVFTWNQRLCFWKGFELYASVAGDYLNFQQYTSGGYLAQDLAFRQVLAAPDAPIWVKVDREMVVGTASGEWVIGAVNNAAGVSGDNITARKQSSYGVARAWPIEPGASVLYVQRGGKQLREAAYDFGTDRYQSANINRWARHIAKPGLIQLGYQQQSEELVFGVRSDGVLVFRSYDPEQQVKGFARRVLAPGKDGVLGKVLSATCIPSEDGATDEIWALCQWDGVKSVQVMTPWWDPGQTDIADAFFVDDGLTDSLVEPSATISGLDHMAGATVAILADGGVCPRQVVPASGTITIPYAAKKRTVGRLYTARLKTLRQEVRDPTGQTSTGKKKRLINVILWLLETSGIKVNAGARDETILDRPTRANMDAPQPLFSGLTPGKSVGGEYDRDGQYEIISDDPRPCFVLAALPRIDVSDR